VYMYVYVNMYVCVYVLVYNYMHARVGVNMHLCRRILFICTVRSIVYQKCFLTSACVCGGELEVGLFSACSWLALVAGVAGYVLVGVAIGVLSCLFLYFGGC